MSYIFTNYITSGSQNTSLSYDEAEFIDRVYQNYRSYIYKVNADISSSTSLIKALVDARFVSKTTEISSYTYKNVSFDKNDPSTWNNLDLIINSITGSNTGNYTSRLIKQDDGKLYFLVGSYLIDISETSVFKCTVNSSSTLSSKSRMFATEQEIIDFISSVSSSIYGSIEGATYLSNIEFTYTTDKDLTQDIPVGQNGVIDIGVARYEFDDIRTASLKA